MPTGGCQPGRHATGRPAARLATHDLAEAQKLTDRVLILAGGQIIADGSPDELALRMSGQAEVRWTVDGQRFVHPTDEATALFLMRGHHVPGTTFSLGSLTLPSGIGIGIVFGGVRAR